MLEAASSSGGAQRTAVVEYDEALTEVGAAWRERASGTHGDRAPHAPGGAAGAASAAAAAAAADDDETQAALRDPDVVEGAMRLGLAKSLDKCEFCGECGRWCGSTRRLFRHAGMDLCRKCTKGQIDSVGLAVLWNSWCALDSLCEEGYQMVAWP